MNNNNSHLRKAYLAGHKACGLKVGDYVKVTRKAEDYEVGWNSFWLGEMDSLVGHIYTILHDEGEEGFGIKVHSTNYILPWFVLEKVTAPKKDLAFTLLDGLDFGCQQDNVKKLIEAFLTHLKGEKK